MQKSERSYDRNAGMITFPDLPDDVWVAGAILVTMDEEGRYSAVFRAESLDETPIVEVQEELGAMIAQSWELANMPGVEA